jgi:hypothetical protein
VLLFTMESSFLPEFTLFGEPNCLTSPLSILLTSSHIVQRSFHVISNAINRLRTLCEKHRGWGTPTGSRTSSGLCRYRPLDGATRET